MVKIEKSPYFCNCLTSFNKIWRNDVPGPFAADQPLKFPKFETQDGGCFFRIAVVHFWGRKDSLGYSLSVLPTSAKIRNTKTIFSMLSTCLLNLTSRDFVFGVQVDRS